MPQLNVSSQLAANGTLANAVANWQYEYIPRAGRVKLIARADGTTLLMQISTGSETIQEESPVQGGGTIGVTPSELNTPPVVFDVAAGDRLKVKVRSTDAGNRQFDAIIYYFPH